MDYRPNVKAFQIYSRNVRQVSILFHWIALMLVFFWREATSRCFHLFWSVWIVDTRCNTFSEATLRSDVNVLNNVSRVYFIF